MNKAYDVYMCRLEQLMNDAISVVGKSRQVMFSAKYRGIFNEISMRGYRIDIHVSGNDMTGNILSVKISKKAPIKWASLAS